MGRKHYRNLVLAKDGIKINGSSMANDIQFATNDPDREKKKNGWWKSHLHSTRKDQGDTKKFFQLTLTKEQSYQRTIIIPVSIRIPKNLETSSTKGHWLHVPTTPMLFAWSAHDQAQ